jgi:hypothetical protein
MSLLDAGSDGRYPPTPAKGDPMPQTREYWEKRAAMDQELIIEQKEEISRLKHQANNLSQKVKSLTDTAASAVSVSDLIAAEIGLVLKENTELRAKNHIATEAFKLLDIELG